MIVSFLCVCFLESLCFDPSGSPFFPSRVPPQLEALQHRRGRYTNASVLLHHARRSQGGEEGCSPLQTAPRWGCHNNEPTSVQMDDLLAECANPVRENPTILHTHTRTHTKALPHPKQAVAELLSYQGLWDELRTHKQHERSVWSECKRTPMGPHAHTQLHTLVVNLVHPRSSLCEREHHREEQNILTCQNENTITKMIVFQDARCG